MKGWDYDDVQKRALKAYFRRSGKNADQPSNDVDFLECKGLDYIQLSNVNGVLAVYRIYEDGSLKFMKNAAIEA